MRYSFNMKTTFLSLLLAGILAAVGGTFFLKNTPPTIPDTHVTTTATSTSATSAPFAEIVRGKLFSLAADKVTKQSEVANGADVAEGSILATDASSHTNIHFADGSVLRMDEKTTVVLNSASYNPDSKTLTARIALVVGSVWSKIVSLATPESVWQVETAHAVATVRGTAFGTTYQKGKTSFLGGEHRVTVAVRDPKTHLSLPAQNLSFAEHQKLEITDATTDTLVKALKEGTSSVEKKATVLLAIRAAAKTDEAAPWVAEAKKEDVKLESIEQEIHLKPELKNGEDLKNTLRQKLQIELPVPKEVPSPTIEQKLNLNTDLKVLPQKPVAQPLVEKPILKTAPIQPIVPSVEGARLVVVAATPVDAVHEGDTVQFKATLVDARGVKHPLENGITWSTSGLTGSIAATTGLFTAKLNDQIAEAGEASGSVHASYKDPATGKTIEGESAKFVVSAQAAPTNDQAI